MFSLNGEFSMSSVTEKDWKLFRKLQSELTARVCDTIFKKVDTLSQQRKGKEHQSYLQLYKLIKDEDRLISDMFDNPTRNNVLFKIIELKSHNVFQDDEFAQFSEETQQRVKEIIELRR